MAASGDNGKRAGAAYKEGVRYDDAALGGAGVAAWRSAREAGAVACPDEYLMWPK